MGEGVVFVEHGCDDLYKRYLHVSVRFQVHVDLGGWGDEEKEAGGGAYGECSNEEDTGEDEFVLHG